MDKDLKWTVHMYQVTLSDGCVFKESRPTCASAPIQGEMRVCGDPDHYPQEFSAEYEDLGELPCVRDSD